MAETSKKSREKKIVFFNQFFEGGNTFFLYEGYEERYQTFRYFLETGLVKGEICLYFYPETTDIIDFSNLKEKYAKTFVELPLLKGNIKALKKSDIKYILNEVESYYIKAIVENKVGFRILIDLGPLRKSYFDKAKEMVDKIHEKIEQPVTSMVSMEMGFIDQESARDFISLNNRTIISTS